jgi:putative flippase GtrA
LSRDRASGQAARFVVVGLSNTLVSLAFYALFAHVFHVPKIPANAIAYFLGIVNSFLWNKFWTFGARDSGRGWREFGFFFLVNVPPWAVNIVVFTVLNVSVKSGSLLIGEAETFAAALVAVVWNFLGSRYLAFRHTALKKNDGGSETGTAGETVRTEPTKKEDHA